MRVPGEGAAQARFVLQHLRQLASDAGDRIDAGDVEVTYGLLLLSTRSFDAARQRFEAARALGAELGDPYLQIAADSGLCDLWLGFASSERAALPEDQRRQLEQQDARRAADIQAGVLDALSRIGDVADEVAAANKLALIHEELDEPAKALQMHQRTLAAAEKTGSLRNQATGWLFLGRWYRGQERWPEALDAIDRCLALVPERTKPSIYMTRAEVHRAMSAPREALADYEAARKLLESDNLLDIARCARGTAEIQWELGDRENAIRNLTEALDVAEALRLPEQQSIRDLLMDWKNAKP
jgi:tetratricopeptide (TPR) repeat protein